MCAPCVWPLPAVWRAGCVTGGVCGGRTDWPSLVKPGGLCVAPWLELLCLSSASPANQKLIEAARSSCCYSNRQHWLTPSGKHVFWHPCSRGFFFFKASPSELLHPHCLQCSSCYFCRQCRFLLCMMHLFSRAWICNHPRSRGSGKVVVIRAMPLQEFDMFFCFISSNKSLITISYECINMFFFNIFLTIFQLKTLRFKSHRK